MISVSLDKLCARSVLYCWSLVYKTNDPFLTGLALT
jgi:hypothetical protein